MPVSLAQAKLNATDDIDVAVIDEFQKSSYLLNALTFDDVVSGAGNGGTLTYGYTRLLTQATAATRAINAEYVPQEVTKGRFAVDLKVLGGSFQIDRILDAVARGAETALQMSQKIKGTVAYFNDLVINGDSTADVNGFDGLSKALTGTSTETKGGKDWAALSRTDDSAFKIADDIDDLLGLLDGAPTALLGNTALLSKIRSAARRTGAYDLDTVSFDAGDTRIERLGNVVLVDVGAKAGSNTPVIPTTQKTVATLAGKYTDLYAVRLGLDGFHAVSMAGSPLVNTWLPDFSVAGAVKTGEVEMGPVATVLKASKSAAVLRDIRLSA